MQNCQQIYKVRILEPNLRVSICVVLLKVVGIVTEEKKREDRSNPVDNHWTGKHKTENIYQQIIVPGSTNAAKNANMQINFRKSRYRAIPNAANASPNGD